MRSCFLRLGALLALLLVTAAGTAIAKSGTETAIKDGEVRVAQACSSKGQGCGIGGGACCSGLWCQNGMCVSFQTAGQQCGNPAVPPCQPGLACVNGTCKKPN